MDKGSILFVDDEQPILRALFRLFRETDYQIYLAGSGEEALAILAEHSVDLVISDMRMPQMNGYELLTKVKAAYPATMRIILSGYSQEKEIIHSLLDGAARMYLLKPWDNEKLLQEVDHVFKLQELLRNRQLLDKIAALEELPTLPAIHQQIRQLIEAEAEIRQIAQVIEGDQVMAVKVLQMANSAFCGVHTGSIKQAVSYLGLAAIKNITLACAVFQDDNQRDKSTLTRLDLLWHHASLTNRIMQLIAEELQGKRLPEDRASIGLVHDIGKVVLLKQYGRQYIELLLAAEQAGRGIEELEKETFGITHQELGGYLLNWWNLPYPFVEAAMFHHDPLQASATNRDLICLLHVANYYAGQKVRPNGQVLQEEILHVLGIQRSDCEKLVKQVTSS